MGTGKRLTATVILCVLTGVGSTTPMPVPTPPTTTIVHSPINVPETTSPTAIYDHTPPDW